ncbi:hypothetical protein RDI58_014759 [Solanum bulbocastanum]|uniref:Storage protein n=1 Tax=Solanum bulbocastanum TaxID=147425 RepID=A0AAN8YAV7_SOLBU
MTTLYRSGTFRRTNDRSRLVITSIMGMVLGYFIGISSPYVSLTKISLPSNLVSSLVFGDDHRRPSIKRFFPEHLVTPQIYVPTNPRGAESLPPRIVVPESDFYLRRLWGEPSAICLNQKDNIDAAVQKFPEDFQILLFHYDGRINEWEKFEWSKHAVHISVRKQTKWWYAKRFLHPDVVAAYDYIFVWDEDLGVENFNAEKYALFPGCLSWYIRLVKRHGLDISQPGLEPNTGLTRQMTKRRDDREVHNFVEIMAPVFSREAWRCVWHMIQNDLVHGWGLDFALRRCVEPAHEKIGVVDSQWIVQQFVPSLGSQGKSENGKAPWEQGRMYSPSSGVRERCTNEWAMFLDRLANADESYFVQHGKSRI